MIDGAFMAGVWSFFQTSVQVVELYVTLVRAAENKTVVGHDGTASKVAIEMVVGRRGLHAVSLDWAKPRECILLQK